MKKFLFLVGVFMVIAAVAGASGGSSAVSERPGSPAVYADIASQTDCAALQATFDRAEANGQRHRRQGNRSLAKATTGYMVAANERDAPDRLLLSQPHKKRLQEDEHGLGDRPAQTDPAGHHRHDQIFHGLRRGDGE